MKIAIVTLGVLLCSLLFLQAASPAYDAGVVADETAVAASPAFAAELIDAPEAGHAPFAIIDPATDLGGWARSAFEAAAGRDWWALAALALVAIVALLRSQWMLGKLKILQTDHGAFGLVLVTSVLLGIADGATAGHWPTWETIKAAGLLAIGAAGGWAGIKKFLWPLASKVGGWLWPKVRAIFA